MTDIDSIATIRSNLLEEKADDPMKKQKFIYTPAVLSMRERDERLVHLVLCGNEDAWNTLYQEAVPWVICAVRGFDRQNFFPDDEHKDIVDEAFTRCYGQLERYQGRSRFRRWVFGYAKNIMYQRRSAQLTAYRNQYLLECAAESQYRGSDPLYILIHLEQVRHLWNAFYMLNKIERRIIFQRVFSKRRRVLWHGNSASHDDRCWICMRVRA